MHTIRTIKGMVAWSRSAERDGRSIGFVPTMGALHEGHKSLIKSARAACDAVVVSIFVNPLQFGPMEDLERYPRPLEEDMRLCRREKVDVVFLPAVDELYPSAFETAVSVQRLTRRFEGISRPGHFGGVATVVTKLLNIVHPGKAFFGQKDYQQAAVVSRLVADLNICTEIIVRPTVREPDGLALSSRNTFLTLEERKAATVLYQALAAARDVIRDGERSAKKIRAAMIRTIWEEPLARLDYAAVADAETLEEVRSARGRLVLLLAVWIGNTRLIDNMELLCR
ncbi:MAG: pantoate--beta-alanine ligase [Nitrospirae bacterium]|nr:MAG: pantoate--beta-alanine ligase [Nitrospirota bacterium]